MSDAPLTARTVNEVRFYMMVHPCPSCGKGPWAYEIASTEAAGDAQLLSLSAYCRTCQHAGDFTFALQSPVADSGSQAQTVNPTDKPSELVDLAGWLSLFHMLLERAANKPSTAASRTSSYQAALCLSEALKFYVDNELPPETAFFTEASLAVFRSHPENFARQRLRDIQEKLPTLPKMARRIDRDDWAGKRKWWQFWRR